MAEADGIEPHADGTIRLATGAPHLRGSASMKLGNVGGRRRNRTACPVGIIPFRAGGDTMSHHLPLADAGWNRTACRWHHPLSRRRRSPRSRRHPDVVRPARFERACPWQPGLSRPRLPIPPRTHEMWCAREDSNLHWAGFEPAASADWATCTGAQGGSRTLTTCGRQILSLVRLPIPPPTHAEKSVGGGS
jgi:hypothetical protein